MDWTAPIDDYCERTSAAFWAEPLNAWTNIAFIAAALLGLSLWKMRGGRDEPALALCLLVAVIGAGSFLFHTVATRWASLADVVPIAVFIYGYFALALSRFFALTPLVAAAGTAVFFAASLVVEPVLAAIVGSSAGYMPGLFALVGVGGILVSRREEPGTLVLGAGATFFVSLIFRMLDAPLCEVWPLGTHAVWHVLNAVTLGLLLVAAIDAPPVPAARRRA
ncbi:ceramidase domain-containing protein [Jiella sonneratiae]|uniref:Ceramidase domain-containing protein n=1 Tax=Jiella sonneratiae TaxID=2816856 RepID=A0ABS3J2P3_9HYPH|nr:ceramidase domain-containing protein [Jiella sonneratiae]MBO0903932.1 ceramidase domain-containing protein [Jiella sonneratiae]